MTDHIEKVRDGTLCQLSVYHGSYSQDHAVEAAMGMVLGALDWLHLSGGPEAAYEFIQQITDERGNAIAEARAREFGISLRRGQ